MKTDDRIHTVTAGEELSDMGWYHDGFGWGGWLLMTLAMVVFWVLVVAAVITLFRSEPRSSRPTALELLDERLARGELTTEEYHAIREALDTERHDRPAAPH